MFRSAVSPRFVTYLHVYLLGIGVDPRSVLEPAGIEVSPDSEYRRPLLAPEAANLYELAAHKLGDPMLGLNLGRKFPFESAGLATLLMSSAPNIGAALDAVISYDRYVDDALDHRVIKGKTSFQHCFRLIVPEPVPARQLTEFLTMLPYQTFLSSTRQQFSPKSISFVHSGDVPARAYEEYFGNAAVSFGDEWNTAEYGNQVLTLPFVTANKLLHNLIQNSLKAYGNSDGEAEFADTVSRELMRQTLRELPSIEIIARNLSISSRTLRRKLLEEGYTFQKVKQMALEKRSKYLLQETNLGLAEIAYELGYSEVSAFSRAFRSWTGLTPQKFRDSHRNTGE